MTPSKTASIILASTSPYRAELLGRLGLTFEAVAPQVDEAAYREPNAQALACTLAEAKAKAVATNYKGRLVIGSDQVAVCEDRLLGKPGSLAAAIEQLQFQRGKTTEFKTAVCVVDSQGQSHLGCVTTHVGWLGPDQLSNDHIRAYVHKERPIDCAGAAKSEGLGVTLIAYMRSDDPTALIGLPLITLTGLLRRAGVEPLA